MVRLWVILTIGEATETFESTTCTAAAIVALSALTEASQLLHNKF